MTAWLVAMSPPPARDPSPRNVHPRRRRDPPPRNVHAAPAAPPRPVSVISKAPRRFGSRPARRLRLDRRDVAAPADAVREARVAPSDDAAPHSRFSLAHADVAAKVVGIHGRAVAQEPLDRGVRPAVRLRTRSRPIVFKSARGAVLGISTSTPRRRRDPSSRNIHVNPAAVPRPLGLCLGRTGASEATRRRAFSIDLAALDSWRRPLEGHPGRIRLGRAPAASCRSRAGGRAPPAVAPPSLVWRARRAHRCARASPHRCARVRRRRLSLCRAAHSDANPLRRRGRRALVRDT